jgi:hypothetical protein
MRRRINLVLFERYNPLFVSYRFLSNKSNEKYQGIREKFDEDQARLYFDKWLKSLW